MARYITDLDSASALQNADIVLVEQSGVDKKSTIGSIKIAVDSYTESEADAKFLKADYTVLADFPTRKYNGTITLSEPLTNFEQIIVEATYYLDENNLATFRYFPTALLTIGRVYYFYTDPTRYAAWVYTNATTFTFSQETQSWIRTIYGLGRK